MVVEVEEEAAFKATPLLLLSFSDETSDVCLRFVPDVREEDANDENDVDVR